MNEIICPHCSEKFKIDENSYVNIVRQVHDKEFESNLEKRINEINRVNDKELELYKKDKEMELQTKENELKEQHQKTIKDRDEEILRLKDMKAKLSTKMVGESLEQHCEIEFNKLRSTAFPRSFFDKDNDASSGSKGDYIFKDYDENGIEFISIMFEMKNENDTTASKSKNEDFLKELDKDRIEKKCEYAVLVSLLETGNDLYNTGIVDVFHKYPKMYVIRPQFFIPMISLLRNAATHSLKFKTELEEIREQNLDVTNFETELDTFKKEFSRNYDLASRQFSEAIIQIDKSIANLENTKKKLLSAENNLRLANNKSQDVSIKRLTRNNPTMTEKFKDLNDDKSNNN